MTWRFVFPVLILLLTACSQPLAPEQVLDVDIEGITAQALIERHRPIGTASCGVRFSEVRGRILGANWVIYKPLRSAWNGDLISVARGYIAPAEPKVDIAALLSSPDFVELRDGVLCLGFAVAASGFRANGFAVEEGTIDTLLLTPIFRILFGRPEHSYVAGLSLGGAITLKLAESFPEVYDGALALCGFSGGSLLQTNYVGNVEMLFRLLYPGVLPGESVLDELGPYGDLPDLGALSIPELVAFFSTPVLPPDIPDTVVERVITAVATDSRPVRGLDVLKTTTVTYASPLGPVQVPLLQFLPAAVLTGPPFGLPPDVAAAVEDASAVAAILRPLFYAAVGKGDVFARTGTDQVFDNNDLLGFPIGYASPLLPGLDPLVKSMPFDIDPAAVAYFLQHYQPNGNLAIPVRTLHTAVDPDVPAWHEGVYGGLVALAGSSSFLKGSLVVDRPFHCNFNQESVIAELLALVAEVEGF